MKNVTEFVHQIIARKVNKDDLCVDMTTGNGNDTLFLAKISKFVYGFDIQQVAIDNTNQLLSSNGLSNYQLFLDSHENIDKDVSIDILKETKCFIYNLGYLPKGNKNVTTLFSSTLSSLKKVLDYLNHQSLVIIVCYPGHEKGKEEALGLVEYVRTLDHLNYEVSSYNILNQDNNPPFALIIERR